VIVNLKAIKPNGLVAFFVVATLIPSPSPSKGEGRKKNCGIL